MFDERKLSTRNVLRAVDRYRSERPKHRPARSAFLIVDGERLPAKQILRLAFHDLIGAMPASEQLTGGRASVGDLTNLGFDAIYEKPTLPGAASLRAYRASVPLGFDKRDGSHCAKKFGRLTTIPPIEMSSVHFTMQ
jgi:hypothetical protein